MRDISYVAAVFIEIEAIVSLSTGRRFNSDPDARFNDSLSYRFTGQETQSVASFKIRLSEDNINWSEWIDYQPGDYYCRCFQLKMILTRGNLGDYVTCSTLQYLGDLPDVDDFGSDEVTNASEGKEVFFIKTYHEDPNVHIEITSGNGIYAQFADKSTTSFKIKLFNAQGVAQVGTFDWHSHGV
jgi:hypothetical protein